MASPEEVIETIDEGKSNRHIAVTSKLNAYYICASVSCASFCPVNKARYDNYFAELQLLCML